MKREIICGIYKITSPSGRIYIGQSKNCLKRVIDYKYGVKNQRLLNSSILKYGWEAHTFEIIHKCNQEELNELEKYYAILFNCYSKIFGMNLRECGGNKGKMSEETKEILRQLNTGKRHSEESKKKMSTIQKGEKAFWYGKNLEESTKIKMSNAHKIKIFSTQHKINLSKSKSGSSNPMYGKKNTDEMRKKNSEANKGAKNANAKLILNTETGIFYGCIKEAWDSFQIQSVDYFKFKLHGKYINNTSFLYV